MRIQWICGWESWIFFWSDQEIFTCFVGQSCSGLVVTKASGYVAWDIVIGAVWWAVCCHTALQHFVYSWVILIVKAEIVLLTSASHVSVACCAYIPCSAAGYMSWSMSQDCDADHKLCCWERIACHAGSLSSELRWSHHAPVKTCPGRALWWHYHVMRACMQAGQATTCKLRMPSEKFKAEIWDLGVAYLGSMLGTPRRY